MFVGLFTCSKSKRDVIKIPFLSSVSLTFTEGIYALKAWLRGRACAGRGVLPPPLFPFLVPAHPSTCPIPTTVPDLAPPFSPPLPALPLPSATFLLSCLQILRY